LADADFRGEVDDAVDSDQRLGDDIAIANVASEELDPRLQRAGRAAITVDLLDEAVEDSDPVTPLQQFCGDRPSNEAGSAGHQYRLAHVPPSPNLFRTTSEYPAERPDRAGRIQLKLRL
jgi:hypothetical protein